MSLTVLLDQKRTLFQSLGAGWLLDFVVDPACLTALETRTAAGEATARWFVEELSVSLERITGPEMEEDVGSFIDRYGEALAYWRLSKRGVLVERIKEQHGVQTPDFTATGDSGKFFVEVKTPRIVANDPGLPRGWTAHEVMVYDSLNARMAMEASAQRPGAHFGELAIDPYRPSLNAGFTGPVVPTKRLSSAQRVNILVRKIEAMIKPEQFSSGPTVLLVPLLRLPLDIDHPSAIVPGYFDEASECVVSGEWWHVGWGQTGDPMLGFPDFPGATNLADRLDRHGIMA